MLRQRQPRRILIRNGSSASGKENRMLWRRCRRWSKKGGSKSFGCFSLSSSGCFARTKNTHPSPPREVAGKNSPKADAEVLSLATQVGKTSRESSDSRRQPLDDEKQDLCDRASR